MKYLFFIWILLNTMITDSCNAVHINNTQNDESVDLYHLVRDPKNLKSQAPVLILLHGYGSNEIDLFSLVDKIPDHWLVISVRAPFELGNNRFKWYDVKLVNEKITMNFKDEEKSRKALLALLDQIISKYNVNKKKVVTAGFSQGANMALALLLTEPGKVLAAGCFSGRFMEEIKPLIKNKEALKNTQVFISHGTKDQMLSIRYAEENKKNLENLGLHVKFYTDDIAHSISGNQLNKFVKWINGL